MDLNKIKGTNNSFKNLNTGNKKATKGYAIVGISANIGGTRNLNGYWDAISNGRDLVRSFPENRWEDAEQLKRLRDRSGLSECMGQAAYLDEIDRFDPGFFSIAKSEADIMDPAQRMFLECAWSAFEDAGYTAASLNKSRTGVYVGYSSQGGQYAQAIEKNADNFGAAVSGNLNSIIASRVNYCFNLIGPAVVFDTACSSSLTALHMACLQLKNGECDMAVAGSVSLTLIPRETDGEKMGIESSSERTKTFDDSADGTGGGEGVIAIVIKTLSRAMEDKDNIYAVIKSSAINQDGTSLGITAPNSAAQEAVIVEAWQDAGIDPLTVSYIEAHGTGTNLGDPVEIAGIENAFKRYTNQKQFCGIGSVKSNVGHLDCAAGLAGVVKSVCMLNNRQIPPTVHFEVPNRKIPFINSPVYVNDTLRTWETGEYPLRCGVSSFGLSGTNVHVVMEEAPKIQRTVEDDKYELITVSAKDKATLVKYIEAYEEYLASNKEISFKDFCYTANSGRSDFNYRFAAIVEKPEDFLDVSIEQTDGKNIFYGSYIITDEENSDGYITEQKKQALTLQVNELVKSKDENKEKLVSIALLYVQGADPQWEELYKGKDRRKISIPTYPYNHRRCWLPSIKEIQINDVKKKKKIHPLIDECIAESYKLKIYQIEMSMESNWELNEHRVNGLGVLPGTAFIEMAQFVGMQYYKGEDFKIRDLIYLSPLSCGENSTVVVQVKLEEKDEYQELSFYSKVEEKESSQQEWVQNSELKLMKAEPFEDTKVDIQEIVKRCEKVSAEISRDFTIVEIVGTHWKDNLAGIYANDSEIVLDLRMSDELWKEAKDYYMIPSVLDQAISSGNFFSKTVYMPYCFKQGYFSKPLPRHFYSYIKKQVKSEEAEDEIAMFDISLCDENGNCFARVNDYALKKVHQPEFFLVGDNMGDDVFNTLEWVEEEDVEDNPTLTFEEDEYLMVFYQNDAAQRNLVNELKIRYPQNVICVEINDGVILKRTDTYYEIGYKQEDYDGLFASLEGKRISRIVQLTAYAQTKLDSSKALETGINRLLQSNFCITKAILNNYIRYSINMVIVTMNCDRVNGEENEVYALNNAVAGYGKSLHDEYQNIFVQALDFDEKISLSEILTVFNTPSRQYLTAYREHIRYIQKMRGFERTAEISGRDIGIKNNGVYLITGGMGGMGLSFTRYLFGLDPTVRIKLLNRSYSDKDIEEGNIEINVRISKKLKTVEELRSRGANIEIIKADVTDYDSLKNILENIRTNEGSICGIIHTAGVPANGFVINKDWTEFRKTLEPKVVGTWNLAELVKHDKPDFFVMCASLASVYGSPGQIDYVVANSFIDSVTYTLRDAGIPTVAIDWTGWKDSGMAIDNNVDENKSLFKFMSDEEGAVAMAFAIKSGLSRILIGKINYQAYTAQADMLESKVELSDSWKKQMKSMGITTHTQISFSDLEITGKSIELLSEVEKDVLLCWGRVLGERRIDLHDKFFESGGNSLLAANLQKEIEKKYPNSISISDIFSCSTVERIAAFVNEQANASKPKLVIGEETKTEIQDVDDDEIDIEALVEQLSEGKIDIELMESMLNAK